MNTFGVLSGTFGISIHMFNRQHFDKIKTLWLETQKNSYRVLCHSLHLPFCSPVYIFFIYICSHKICGFTWVGVKSENVRFFFSHILVELCATPIPFSSIFPSFHISIGTSLSHQMSCSQGNFTFWPVTVMKVAILKKIVKFTKVLG